MDDIFDAIIGSFNPVREASSSITLWIQTFTTQGVVQITKRLIASDPCEHPGCATRLVAGVKCGRCKRSVCLGHAFLSAQGHGICFTCVGVQETAAPPPRQRDARTGVEERATVAAYARFGLEPGATEDEVNKARKRLLRDNHPDKHGISAAEIARRTAFAKEIGHAYAFLRKAKGWDKAKAP